jgi:predicted phosphodiesterase
MQLKKSKISAVISDIHFPYQEKKSWAAFKSWIKDVKPHNLYVNGDIFDFESLSTFPKGKEAKPHIVHEMQEGIKELNELRKYVTGEVIVLFGNHEDRWARKLTDAFGMAGKGLKGITLEDQLYLQGLDPKIKIKLESVHNIGAKLGQFVIRHGDKQASKSGNYQNIAAGRLRKTCGASEVVGHFHQAQMSCLSFDGKTSIAVANPCLTGPHAYAVSASWQNGFTILEEAPNGWVTPYVVVMHNGLFSWAGKVYQG